MQTHMDRIGAGEWFAQSVLVSTPLSLRRDLQTKSTNCSLPPRSASRCWKENPTVLDITGTGRACMGHGKDGREEHKDRAGRRFCPHDLASYGGFDPAAERSLVLVGSFVRLNPNAQTVRGWASQWTETRKVVIKSRDEETIGASTSTERCPTKATSRPCLSGSCCPLSTSKRSISTSCAQEGFYARPLPRRWQPLLQEMERGIRETPIMWHHSRCRREESTPCRQSCGKRLMKRSCSKDGC